MHSINMTPQIMLNHKLRSVEAMPMRVFFYRFLNTIVDDLVILAIPMPGLTRVAAFRDDIIFVIILLQWYYYPKRRRDDQEKEKTE